jgi:hypothetical protein
MSNKHKKDCILSPIPYQSAACQCHSLQKESEWEKEFDEKLSRTQEPVYNKNLKDFIRKVLSNRENEIAEEVEKESRKSFPTQKPIDYEIGYKDGLDKGLSIINPSKE